MPCGVKKLLLQHFSRRNRGDILGYDFLLSVIVNDLNIQCMTILKAETDTPLVVDAPQADARTTRSTAGFRLNWMRVSFRKWQASD